MSPAKFEFYRETLEREAAYEQHDKDCALAPDDFSDKVRWLAAGLIIGFVSSLAVQRK